MKAGDRLWIAVRVNDDAEDAIDELVIHDPDDINVTHWARIEEDTPIPDSPMLPAVARWLAGLPEWLDAAELASALETVLVMSKEGQAMTCHDAVPSLYERQEEFVEASDNIQPHGWEALESLIAALTEGQA